MTPGTILTKLGRLRRRERILALTWGVARWLALALILLSAACLADWLIDRWQDTPWELRLIFLVVQAVLWAVAGTVLILWPLLRRLSNRKLALEVEAKVPTFEHRLISVVELHEPGADTRGMSPELIAMVAAEAETRASQVLFARLADHRRLKWSLLLGVPLLAAAVGVFLAWPATVRALLARQMLADIEIPRSVHLIALNNEQIVPSGTEVVLRFHASGRVDRNMQGEVRIDPDGEPAAHYPLTCESMTAPDQGVFAAHVPISAVDFLSCAWLADGRTHQPSRAHFEARPAVVEQRAWVLLPDYVGHRPDGTPYEQEQPRGDIAGLLHSQARVVIHTQKPIVRATLELSGSRRRRLPMRLSGDQLAEASFRLQPEETMYRVLVEDRYGFTNAEPARRSIRIVTEDMPRVVLLPERFPGMSADDPEDDTEVDGVPVPLGGGIRIAYWCAARYGLGRTRLRYRINDGPWTPLPLQKTKAPAENGPFDPRRGAFVNSGLRDQVEFYAVPSADPTRMWDGVEGGGRFDFQTRGLVGLKVGDHIEFFVEAFDRNPDPDRAPGRSESRIKAVVTLPELEQWVRQTVQEESRLRGLERGQHRVFADANDASDDEPSTDETALADTTSTPNQTTPAVHKASTFVREWQLLGPLPNIGDRGHDIAYPPETDRFDLLQAYEGIHGKVRWKTYVGETDKVNLERFFKHSEAGVAYAACWVHSDRAQTALLATGSDDGIKVWLNRKLVLDRRVHREAVPGDDKTTVQLAAGWNEVLVKVDNTFGSWAFFLELCDPATGAALPGISVRHLPLAQDSSRFVRGWKLLGPFPNPELRGHEIAFPPETDPVDVTKQYDGLNRKVGWRSFHSPTGKIDLARFLAEPFEQANVTYAVCWVRSPTTQNVTLATGSHDGIKLWVNRRLVLDRKVQREAAPDDDNATAELRNGWNELLVKVDNRFGRSAFYLEVRDPHDGQTLPGLQYSIYPPPEWGRKGLDAAPAFLREWLVIGPFANQHDHGFDTAFPPEQQRVSWGQHYRGLHSQVHWKPVHATENRIDLAHIFGTQEAAVGYAACWVRTDHQRPALVRVGSDDGIKVWLNRQPVLSRHIHRAAKPGQDTAHALLDAGWNELFVKVENLSGPWEYYFELLDPATNKSLTGVEIRARPPAGAARQPQAAAHEFLRSWQVIGPFPNRDNRGHHTVYPPEKDPLDLRKTYAGMHGLVGWRLDHSKQDYIDLANFLQHRDVGVAYAICWIHAGRSQPVHLSIGSNDGIKIWVDDRLAFSHDIGRKARPRQDQGRADLHAGWNRIMVKVTNRGNDWGFYLALSDPSTGLPPSSLRYRGTPPDGQPAVHRP